MQLPTLPQFKEEAKALKIKERISHSKALEILAQKYGFKNYNTIKPKLENTENKKLKNEEVAYSWHYFLEGLLKNSLHVEGNGRIRIFTEYSYHTPGPEVYSKPIKELYESLLNKAKEMMITVEGKSLPIITDVKFIEKDECIEVSLDDSLSSIYNNYYYNDTDSYDEGMNLFIKETVLHKQYRETTGDNTILLDQPTEHLMNSADKYPLIHLYILIKHSKITGYYEFGKKKKNVEQTVKNLELLLGYKINILKTYNNTILYWDRSAKTPVDKKTNTNMEENKFFCLYTDDSRQGMVREIVGDEVKYSLFEGSAMHISDEVLSMPLKATNKDIFFVKTDRDMRMMHKLIHDIANREDFNFFDVNAIGLEKAAYIVNTNIKLAEFILSKLYGYNIEHV